MRMFALAIAAPLAVSLPAKADVPARLMTCAAEVNDAKRLSCYDDVAKSLSADARRIAEQREKLAAEAAVAAEAARKAAEAEAAAAAAQRKQDEFGIPASAREEQVDQLQAKVQEAFTDRNSKLVVLLDNGQLWRQTDGMMLATVRPGAAVDIKRGMLGSFMMTIPSIKRTVPVTRVR